MLRFNVKHENGTLQTFPGTIATDQGMDLATAFMTCEAKLRTWPGTNIFQNPTFDERETYFSLSFKSSYAQYIDNDRLCELPEFPGYYLQLSSHSRELLGEDNQSFDLNACVNFMTW